MLERLTFGEGEGYDALVLGEHLARYQLARPLCAGRTVLDMACGQGYGTRLIADWGAERVVGVDVSAEAIERARALFQRPGVEYLVASAETVDSLLPAGGFDLIVSLETIEHVPDPARFLRALRKLARDDATIIVSCPNDHIYFSPDEPGNPFHLRRYTLEDFVRESEAVLGRATAWYLGAPGIAFVNYPVGGLAVGDERSGNAKLFESRPVDGYLVPTKASEAPSERTASYYVGVWGPAGDLSSMAGYAITFDYLKNMWTWWDKVVAARAESEERLRAAQQDAAALERQLAESSRAADAEVAALRRQLAELTESHRAQAEESARTQARYGAVLGTLERIRMAMPASLRHWLGRRRLRRK